MVEQGIKSEKYIFAAFESPDDDTVYYDCLIIVGNKLYVKNGNPSLHMIYYPDENAFDVCTDIGKINDYGGFLEYFGETLGEEDLWDMFSNIELNEDGRAYLSNIFSYGEYLKAFSDNIAFFKKRSRRNRSQALGYRKVERNIQRIQDESPEVEEMTYLIKQDTEHNCRLEPSEIILLTVGRFIEPIVD